MDNNDYFRRLRYALQLDDANTQALLALVGRPVSVEQVAAWRAREEDSGFQVCPADIVSAMLDGLIIDRRGPPPVPPQAKSPAESNNQKAAARSPTNVLDNNAILKQLRIALSLRTDGVHELIVKGGGKMGKTEVNALFRNPSARNFRRCGDQVIRWFLAGLASVRDQH